MVRWNILQLGAFGKRTGQVESRGRAARSQVKIAQQALEAAEGGPAELESSEEQLLSAS
jgi:hypothetical protein